MPEREDAGEDGLQARVFTLFRQEVHLQEPLVRLSLDVDQIRQRHIAANLGEVVTNRLLFRHGSVHSMGLLVCTTRQARPLCRLRKEDYAMGEPCGEGRSPLLRLESSGYREKQLSGRRETRAARKSLRRTALLGGAP